MANEYDYESGGGSGFMMGLLTGTVLGAGLGMLFAPKSGSELRGQIAESASNIRNTASEGYQKVADRGRDVMGRARDAVNRGSEEARRYTSEADQALNRNTSGTGSSSTGSPGSSTPGSPYSAGPTRS